jgi:DNA-directed RNA polymerase specialized sigma24 family protein
MGFNYALEKKKFDTHWALKKKTYRKAGMAAADIQLMKDFDWEFFLSERRYRMHTQPLPAECITENDEDSMSGLFKKFDSLKVTFSESDFSGRYSWVDAIEDDAVADKLKNLKLVDLELLTLIVIDDLTQEEIALLQGCTQGNISLKLTRLKKYFSKG